MIAIVLHRALVKGRILVQMLTWWWGRGWAVLVQKSLLQVLAGLDYVLDGERRVSAKHHGSDCST